MATMTAETKTFLESTFNDRVSFEKTERMLYGHDIGDMPKLIKPLVGNTLPDAVVQPNTQDELVSLLIWADEREIPITPRGKATSGYGGVLPVKNGVVVDFYRLSNLIHVDKEAMTITVEAGMVWEQLDKQLAKEGVTLRLYPTSYMASTVGGWLAQGGAGIGSYEYGWFRENVVGAKIILPGGEVRSISYDDLDMVSDAEGITGFISEVTLRVQPLEDLETVSVRVPSATAVKEITKAITEADLPIWSILFINPKMAELKNQAPLMEHLGHVVEKRVELPRTFIITVTYRSRDAEAVEPKLESIISAAGGEKLERHIADHEWEKRFKVMQIKRLGPSLVPAEFVIPLDHLDEAFIEMGKKIAQPLVKEGIVIKNGSDGAPEVVILGFIPSDQRKFNHHFVFSLSLSIMKIAEKYGGRAYTTGLYFANKAPVVLGKERLAALKEYKANVDPKGILNPGKVYGSNLVSTAISAAKAVEPLTRIFGNSTNVEIGARPKKDVKGIPADVAWYAYTCSQCGYCIDECDQFYGRGWESQSPRGKWYWLREYMEGREKWSQKMVDSILACTTCELCNHRCSESIPIEPSWMKLRGKLIHEDGRMSFPPFYMMAEAVEAEGNIWAGYRKDRLNWFPEDLKEKHGPGVKSKAVYFGGCTVSYVEHDIGIASVRILDEAGVDFTHVGERENCCGTPMLVAGKWDVFVEAMKENIESVKAAGADTVISSCPACDMMWRAIYPIWAEKEGIEYNITAKHYSEVIAEKIKTGEFTFPENGHHKEKVAWHDSCHMGRVSGVYEPPRELIKANPKAEFVEMASNRAEGKCCGSVLTLIKEPPVAAELGKHRLDEAIAIGAEKVLALCPCCEFQLRVSAEKKDLPVEIVDLARYTAESLGYDLPDPNPEVKRQWAVFEAMIALMTPKGFADLMGTMWPELIDAMPLGMGKMMRLMGKIPLTLEMMKPMYPILFPILLPKMMAKLMPTMLDRIAGMVPMPDYMAEQMPGMMPKVMDSLMPHMIGDVVPLITQPMVDYLRGRTD